MEVSSIEIATGSFTGSEAPPWRWLDASEASRAIDLAIEEAQVRSLRAAGILLSPFDVGSPSARTKFKKVKVPDWDGDPFAATPVVVQTGTVEEELVVPWSAADQKAAIAFEAGKAREILDRGLSATDQWLARRSPFNVSPRVVALANEVSR